MIGAPCSCAVQAPPSTFRLRPQFAIGNLPAGGPPVWSGRGNTQPQPTATAPAPVKAAFRLFPHRRGDPARHLGWQLRRRRAPPAPLLGLAGNGKPFHLPLVAATKLATINQGKVLSAVHTTVPSILAEPDASLLCKVIQSF